MKSICVVFVTIIVFAVIAHAYPSFPQGDGEHHLQEPVHGDRHRRVTCDIMSVDTQYGSVNHAACALHCIAMMKGYRGGRCIDGVCNCRR